METQKPELVHKPFDNSIRDPQRISRIMDKIKRSKIPIILRVYSPVSISAKAKIAGTTSIVKEENLLVHGLSPRADKALAQVTTLRVDLIGMSASVRFECEVICRSEGELVLTYPKSIQSLERRANRRLVVNPNGPQCYFDFAGKVKGFEPATATPVMPHCHRLAQYVRSADVSLSGACLSLRFPELGRYLRPDSLCQDIAIALPMQPPRPVSFKVRWIKKIRERSESSATEQMLREFKVGIEFVEVDEWLRASLSNFMIKVEVGHAV